MGELKPSEVERIKLTANFLNTVASGILLAAVVVPFVGFAIGTPNATFSPLRVAALSAAGLGVALVLHLIAQWILAGLDR
jgi:hypothetical protein